MSTKRVKYVKDESRKMNDLRAGDLFVIHYDEWHRNAKDMEFVADIGHIFKVIRICTVEDCSGRFEVITYQSIKTGQTRDHVVSCNSKLTVVVPVKNTITERTIDIGNFAHLVVKKSPFTGGIYKDDVFLDIIGSGLNGNHGACFKVSTINNLIKELTKIRDEDMG